MVGSSNRPSQAWPLIKASWRLLLRDKKLLVFPALSGICCAGLAVAAFPQLWYGSKGKVSAVDKPVNNLLPRDVLVLFAVYLGLQFIIIFFNCAIVACITAEVEDEEPTLRKGLSVAVDCLPQIAIWALLSATVGAVLKVMETVGKFQELVAVILETSWAAASFLVIPVLVVERKTGLSAVRASSLLLKETWREGLGNGLRLFRVSVYVSLGGVFLLALSSVMPSNLAMIACIALTALYFLAALAVQATLRTILQAVLYNYARYGFVAEGFRRDTLKAALLE